MQLIWVNFSGYAFYAPSTNDGSFSISITPNYGYYLTKNFEIVTGYSFIYTKFGSLSQINSSINHQVSLTGRFYPFRKLNFIYVESGLQAGNYTIEKISESIQRNLFSTNLIAGFGFEILPRKGKYVINFSALYAFPFNRMFKPDFIRSLGFGFVIKK
ncbi:MAG: hypothetical protein ACKVOW_06115 [Chitinophagaceae bacterium]